MREQSTDNQAGRFYLLVAGIRKTSVHPNCLNIPAVLLMRSRRGRRGDIVSDADAATAELGYYRWGRTVEPAIFRVIRFWWPCSIRALRDR